MAHRFKPALPYVLGLVIAAVLFVLAGQINYTPRGDQLGPDFWPRVAIGLMEAVCLYEIIRVFVTGGSESEVQGIAERLDDTEADADDVAPRSRPTLIIAGVVLTIAYAVLVPVLGFLLASYLYLILFMYLGGSRNHLAIWLSSTIGIFAFAFVFLKVVYVSLPRGQPPFDQVTQLVMDLLLIR